MAIGTVKDDKAIIGGFRQRGWQDSDVHWSAKGKYHQAKTVQEFRNGQS
jgi:hypothetical protein